MLVTNGSVCFAEFCRVRLEPHVNPQSTMQTQCVGYDHSQMPACTYPALSSASDNQVRIIDVFKYICCKNQIKWLFRFVVLEH